VAGVSSEKSCGGSGKRLKENRNVRLVSRRGHLNRSFPVLCDSIRHDLKAADAILDGEIVCLDAEGRSPRISWGFAVVRVINLGSSRAPQPMARK